MKRKCFCFLPEGFEEIEALATVDILRRGGADVSLVSLTQDKHITGGKNVVVHADITFDKFLNLERAESDVFILPGGPGTDNYLKFPEFEELMRKSNNLICAICAAPSILDQWGILDGITAVCHPSRTFKRAKLGEKSVEIQERFITAKGPSSTFEFALAVLKNVEGEEAAKKIESELKLSQ